MTPEPRPFPGMALRRGAFLLLTAGTTVLGGLLMLRIVGSGGLLALELAVLALFLPTFGWITVAFWTAVAGFLLRLLERDPLTLERAGAIGPDPQNPPGTRNTGAGPSARTAVVMPVFNEDPERVLRGLTAVATSLERTGHGALFDFFLLSDTREPEWARREEDLFRALGGASAPEKASGPGTVLEIPPGSASSAPVSGRLVYRRRPGNPGRKAGNVREFCRRWGSEYDLMVVLDADSLMTGDTVLALVREMEADPELGLVQTVPLLARQETLFGRLVQFGAVLQAPMLAAGQSFWQGDSANYWGHNAILRVAPFTEHCVLPVLPGRPPLGGEILSHDFVEAALLRGAGWKVRLRTGQEGSFEEVPGHVLGYAARDRRWCQGSLQHLRLLARPGLHPLSRVHFAFGAMGYLSSLLWLLMLVGSTVYVFLPQAAAWTLPDTAGGLAGPAPGLPGLASPVSLLVITGALLLVPRVLALTLAALRRSGAHGGPLRLAASWILETTFSVVVAPVLMMYHSRFVVSVVLGRDVPWTGGGRARTRVSWKGAWRGAGWITGVGVAWAGITLWASGVFFLWLSPIFVGLILAVPLVRWTSRTDAGRWARARGLFLVPSETSPHYVVRTAEERRIAPPIPDATMEHAERALFELRRGRLLLVTSPSESGGELTNGGKAPSGASLVAAVEGLRDDTLRRLVSLGSGRASLVMTSQRARSIGIPGATNGAGAGNGTAPPGGWSVLLGRNGDTPTAAELLHLSSSPRPALSPGDPPRTATDTEVAGLELVRAGRMLPAVVSVPAEPESDPDLDRALESGEILRVGLERIRALTRASRVEVRRVSDARVPLVEADDARFVLFREVFGLQEHLAILVGDPGSRPDPLPVRLHSACLTGDLFGSLRCDCGEQLRGSLRFFAERGGGVLLYLEQEGRGIGLGNKLRAYSLQQEGLDTVDANCALGFEADERSYEAAVAILRDLGIHRVELLTNNPEKMRALEKGGVRVVDRRALHGTLNRHNLPYVRAKVQRAGHWLEEMLASGLEEAPPDP